MQEGYVVVDQVGQTAKVEIRVENSSDVIKFDLIRQSKKLVMIKVAPVVYKTPRAKGKRERFVLLEIVWVQQRQWAEIAEMYLHASHFLAECSRSETEWEGELSRMRLEQALKRSQSTSGAASASPPEVTEKSRRTRAKRNRDAL